MLIDLHTHTEPLSDDSELKPTELINRAKQAGLDAICLTEHDRPWDKDAIAKLSQEHDFLILPGVEISIDEGHLLVFGVEEDSFSIEYILSMHRAEYVKHIVDEAGGFIILAHPYRRQLYNDDDLHTAVERFCQKPLFHLVDTIEVLNGKASERENRFAQELCRKLNLKGIGGSDAHSISDIPSCATLFERNISNVEQLITELKAGRFRAVDLRSCPASLDKRPTPF